MRYIQIPARSTVKRALFSVFTALTLSVGHNVVAGPVNPPCDEISGTFIATSFVFLNSDLSEAAAQAEIWMDGELVGYAEAHYLLAPKGNGVIQATFSHNWIFLDGSTIRTQDEGLLILDGKNPGWGRANSRLHIVEGTGVFAGATGLVHTHGELNIFTLEGSIDFKGQICVPE